jgi:hypothetical protein
VILTGIFSDAVVEGFRSWEGEGARFREAVWIVEASSRAGFSAMMATGECVEGRNLGCR